MPAGAWWERPRGSVCESSTATSQECKVGQPLRRSQPPPRAQNSDRTSPAESPVAENLPCWSAAVGSADESNIHDPTTPAWRREDTDEILTTRKRKVCGIG